MTLRGLVGNTTVAFDEVTLGDAIVTLEIAHDAGFEDVYLETADGSFCLSHGDLSFVVLR